MFSLVDMTSAHEQHPDLHPLHTRPGPDTDIDLDDALLETDGWDPDAEDAAKVRDGVATEDWRADGRAFLTFRRCSTSVLSAANG